MSNVVSNDSEQSK